MSCCIRRPSLKVDLERQTSNRRKLGAAEGDTWHTEHIYCKRLAMTILELP